MKAEIKIECKNPNDVIKALEPDIEKSDKFNVKLEPKENKIELKIESNDISGLLAGISSYLRLIKTALAVEEID